MFFDAGEYALDVPLSRVRGPGPVRVDLACAVTDRCKRELLQLQPKRPLSFWDTGGVDYVLSPHDDGGSFGEKSCIGLRAGNPGA